MNKIFSVQEQYDYAKAYSGNNEFMRSMRKRIDDKRGITDGMYHVINQIMNEEQRTGGQPAAPGQIICPNRDDRYEKPENLSPYDWKYALKWTRPMTYNVGDEVEINKWVVGKIKKQLNLPFFFRHLEITEVLHETQRAVKVKVKFITKIGSNCHCCGLPLDCEISRACGIGPVCAKHLGLNRAKLGDAKAILERIEQIAKEVGEVGPVWLPKAKTTKLVEEKQEEQHRPNEDTPAHIC